jgi:hypothetical protein
VETILVRQYVIPDLVKNVYILQIRWRHVAVEECQQWYLELTTDSLAWILFQSVDFPVKKLWHVAINAERCAIPMNVAHAKKLLSNHADVENLIEKLNALRQQTVKKMTKSLSATVSARSLSLVEHTNAKEFAVKPAKETILKVIIYVSRYVENNLIVRSIPVKIFAI